MKKLKKILTYGFILCLGLMQVGCGGNSVSTSAVQYDSGFAGGVSSDYMTANGVAKSYSMSEEVYYDSDDAYSYTPETSQVSNQKLIRTVNMNIELESNEYLAETVSEISKISASHGGYTTYSNVDMDTRYAYGRMTLKVPKENVDDFLNVIKENGYVVKSTTDSYEDVTLEYTDVQSRLSTKERARKRYESILDGANTVEEIVSVQSKIDSITEEIESAQARLSVMNNRIDYTEISINIDCKTSIDRESFWERAKSILGNIFYEAGDQIIYMIEWIVHAVIFLVFFIPIAFIVIKIFLIAIGKRRFSLKNILRRKKKEVNTEETQSQYMGV